MSKPINLSLLGLLATAAISPCGMYRYHLTRQWNAGDPLRFVMLNPSTADASEDDPTIKKRMGFARVNGFDGIEVFNLFAYRSTIPNQLLPSQGKTRDPVGSQNDSYLRQIPEGAEVACAWGMFAYAQPSLRWRVDAAQKLLKQKGCRLKCVKKTGDKPWHPLYVKYGPLIDL